MTTQSHKTKPQPFPQSRPDIVIKELDAEPFAVDSREVRWHVIVPQIGEQVRWAEYDGPGWGLWNTTHSRAVRPARIHGQTGVEIEVEESQREKGRLTQIYARQTETMVEVLAVAHLDQGGRELLTFLDLDDWDWSNCPRKLADQGYVKVLDKGVFERVGSTEEEVVAGLCSVQVGEQEFTCLRIFGVGEEISESEVLVEAYITREGRTLLWRPYNGRHWAKGGWEERLPDADRIVFNGMTFVHWYDNVTALACGLDG
jgi:hypothetical protein